MKEKNALLSKRWNLIFLAINFMYCICPVAFGTGKPYSLADMWEGSELVPKRRVVTQCHGGSTIQKYKVVDSKKREPPFFTDQQLTFYPHFMFIFCGTHVGKQCF